MLAEIDVHYEAADQGVHNILQELTRRRATILNVTPKDTKGFCFFSFFIKLIYLFSLQGITFLLKLMFLFLKLLDFQMQFGH